jgi:hypothetical protein
MEGMTPQKALDTKPDTFDRAVSFDGFGHIL